MVPGPLSISIFSWWSLVPMQYLDGLHAVTRKPFKPNAHFNPNPNPNPNSNPNRVFGVTGGHDLIPGPIEI